MRMCRSTVTVCQVTCKVCDMHVRVAPLPCVNSAGEQEVFLLDLQINHEPDGLGRKQQKQSYLSFR